MFAPASSPLTPVAGASIAPAAAPIIATASRRLTADEICCLGHRRLLMGGTMLKRS
jgi:hypothetical protein